MILVSSIQGLDVSWQYQGDLYYDGILIKKFSIEKDPVDGKYIKSVTLKSSISNLLIEGPVITTPVLIIGNACLEPLLYEYQKKDITLLYLKRNIKGNWTTDIYLEPVELKVLQYRKSIGI